MRPFPVVSIAMIFLAACHSDRVLSGAAACPPSGALNTQFSAITVSSSQLSSCFISLPGNGATYLVVGQFASVGDPAIPIDWELGTTSAATGSAAADSRLARATGDNPMGRRFEATLRKIERSIAPRVHAETVVPAAPAAGRASALNAAIAAPPPIGSTRTFKVVAAVDGSSFTSATARLVFSGDHVLVYVDTIGGGFSDAQYESLGALFDKDLYSIDINAFGSVSDIDQNGRVIALFTPKINALANPANCAFAGYITGFFYGTDLLVSDPNSNKGEIFYSYIPDSTGTFNCPHTAASVMQVIGGNFLHQLQHMISFNQHVLVRGGALEADWLNEGLGQIAEELGSEYYEAKYPPPSGRSTTTQIFPDSAGPFIQPQLLDAYVYLGTTRAHSVTSYNGGGSLEERGATWLFLRWLASQKTENIFGRLVQTSNTGIANIEAQAGERFGALFGDFSAALQVDSIPGLQRSSVPARFRFGARNLRQLMAREATVEQFTSIWPLPTYLLGIGGALSSNMIPGTMVHSTITTAAGGPAISLTFTAPEAMPFPLALGAQVTIFRMTP
jgi:hypothetical protein